MIKPLEYHSGISLQEAEERYREIEIEIRRIEPNYPGLFGRLKKINPEDKKLIYKCLNVLLPLEVEVSVQNQAKQTKTIDGVLVNRVRQLNAQITNYLLDRLRLF